MPTLTQVVREVVARLDQMRGGESVADIVAPLRAYGITPGCHVGEKDRMDDTPAGKELVLRWYAGQILDIVKKEAWFAMNSIINDVDRFAPVEPPAGCTLDGICTVPGCALCAAGEKSVDQNAVVHGGAPTDGFERLRLVDNPNPHPAHIRYRAKIAR